MDEDMDGIGDIGHGVGINANKSVGALVAGNAELLLLIENQEALSAKVNEAIAVLNDYNNQGTTQAEQPSA